MQCSQCGGLVTWRGPLSAVTHTECQGCGAINSQLDEGDPIECETCEGAGTIDETLGGEFFSDPEATCPDCDGSGEL